MAQLTALDENDLMSKKRRSTQAKVLLANHDSSEIAKRDHMAKLFSNMTVAGLLETPLGQSESQTSLPLPIMKVLSGRQHHMIAGCSPR